MNFLEWDFLFTRRLLGLIAEHEDSWAALKRMVRES